MRLSKLTKELALALEVASIAQAWGNPSPFQDKINELLVKAGRKPVAPNKVLHPAVATEPLEDSPWQTGERRGAVIPSNRNSG